MRLLNTQTQRFKEFLGSDIPSYAILSHRWGDDEVSYHEFLAITVGHELLQSAAASLLRPELEAKKTGAGFRKICDACALAAKDGLQWIWIDTCCIDKSSSAELSEAINSMYAWYRNSGLCYAYLVDVDDTPREERPTESFTESSWFKRGWTLQELLAPRKVRFVNAGWQVIGSKHQLAECISLATKIPQICLISPGWAQSRCVATKMRWAAARRTTRVEDQAYCLLGLFNISMPLHYGEGRQAFWRLQEAIMAQSDDHTIFAHYHAEDVLADAAWQFGLPVRFRRMVTVEFLETKLPSLSFSITNMGVKMQVAFVDTDRKVIALKCMNETTHLPLLLPIHQHKYDGTWSVDGRTWQNSINRCRAPEITALEEANAKLERYCDNFDRGIRQEDPFTYDEITITSDQPESYLCWRRTDSLRDTVSSPGPLTRAQVRGELLASAGSPHHLPIF